jgi:deoxyribonuclease V
MHASYLVSHISPWREERLEIMIAAFDVHYLEDDFASAAAVLFSDYRDAEPFITYTQSLPRPTPYIPGQFYRRELPCILTLLEQIKDPPDEIVVDAYVMLGNKPGLGRILYNHLKGNVPVIGVAKSRFEGSSPSEVYRGSSKNPLYITSAGIDIQSASERIRMMHGPFRVPTLLKRVDLLSRGIIEN